MKTIRKGDEGLEVEILQKLLTLHKEALIADGQFGSGTEKALIAFQLNNFDDKGQSLLPDGIAGPATWQSLIETNYQEVSTSIPEIPIDNVTVNRIQTIHPTLREELTEIYHEIRARGIGVRFTQVFRTFAQQDALYAKGRTTPGKRITNARGGQSYHNYGLAVDIVLLLPGGKVSWDMNLDLDKDGQKDWNEIVYVFKSYGWAWGGDWSSFKDNPHFEKAFGMNWRELKERYLAKDFEKKPYVRLT